MTEPGAMEPAGPASKADPAVERIAGQFRSFVAGHGGNGRAVISYLGRPGYG